MPKPFTIVDAYREMRSIKESSHESKVAKYGKLTITANIDTGLTFTHSKMDDEVVIPVKSLEQFMGLMRKIQNKFIRDFGEFNERQTIASVRISYIRGDEGHDGCYIGPFFIKDDDFDDFVYRLEPLEDFLE